jgi:hypothetical protein
MQKKIVATMMLTSMLMLGGCGVLAGAAVAGAGTAVYYQGKLNGNVEAPFEETVTATKTALREQGVTIDTFEHEVTSGEKVAEFHGVNEENKQVWVDLSQEGDGPTQVTLRVGIVGDEGKARDILGSIQQEAGVLLAEKERQQREGEEQAEAPAAEGEQAQVPQERSPEGEQEAMSPDEEGQQAERPREGIDIPQLEPEPEA